MEYRIKAEHLGKRISKGIESFELTNELTQQQLLYIKNMISDEFVEEKKSFVDVVNELFQEEPIKNVKKRKNDTEDSNKSE